MTENILFDCDEGMDVVRLAKSVNEQFNLSFTVDEIAKALKKKGNQRIALVDDKYVLTDKAKNSIAQKITPLEKLGKLITIFLENEESSYDTATVSKLLKRYFYFAFNSNIQNLLFLINKTDTEINTSTFEANNAEILLINRFLMWDNAEKDEFVYTLVAICYEYCMLTVKKDEIVSTELFRGKKFFLDANIIFRMAGINNEERRFATQSFVEHCKKVGIELSCTNGTLDEVYRVLIAQVEHVKLISGPSMPVACDVLEKFNPQIELNDFYRIYYDWCNSDGNNAGDFLAFHRYLLTKTQDVVEVLSVVESSSYRASIEAKSYEAQVRDLKEFKSNRRKVKNISTASAETDATNILDIIKWRNGAGSSIWQTNEFMVSADQGLIAWAAKVYPGVPIVVLPSVWLSLILRFTGRTDDDYKSFCLFLTQRQHISHENLIDPTRVLSELKYKTNDRQLKEKIIVELTQNKDAYIFNTDDDYEVNITRAFDKVVEEAYNRTAQEIAAMKAEMQEQLACLAQTSSDDARDRAKMEAESERQRTIDILAKKKANQVQKKWLILSRIEWAFYLLGAIFILGGFVVWGCEIEPIYSWGLENLPAKMINANNFNVTWTVVSAGIALLGMATKNIIKKQSSMDKRTEMVEQYRKEYKKETEAE